MLNNKKQIGLIVLGTLGTIAFANAQPDLSGRPGAGHPRLDAIHQEGPPPGDMRPRKSVDKPNPGRIIGRLFHKYDRDTDGQLMGLELKNATLDMVVQRPLRTPVGGPASLDLAAEAETLEERLLRDFDIDADGAISPRELIIAMEAMRPPTGVEVPETRHGNPDTEE